MPLPNVTFILNGNKEFHTGIDRDTRRGTEPAVILQSTTTQWGISGTALRGVDCGPLLGKRIRFSAYVKCRNLANWGSLMLIAMGDGGRILACDDMGGRPITKTTDWTKMEIVTDIPRETVTITLGLNLRGAGQIWMDSAQIDVVGSDVPITDDQNWHPWSFSSPLYSKSLDASVQRGGHPTILLSSTTAKTGYWFAWDHNDRHPDKYLGKRIKMTAWIKTENVTAGSGLSLRIIGPGFQDLVPDAGKPRRTIRGTTDWKRYEVIAAIPEETQVICSGVRLYGKGKLWLDDVQYELIDSPPAK